MIWTLLIGLAIPAISLDLKEIVEVVTGQLDSLKKSIVDLEIKEREPLEITLSKIFLLVYIFRLAYMGFKFSDEYWLLQQKFRNHNKLVIPESNALYFKEPFPGTSFFAYAFWNRPKAEDPELFVIKNSSHKVRTKHGWEVFLLEIIQILYWFNPVVYKYVKAFKQNNSKFLNDFMGKEGILPDSKESSSLYPIQKINSFLTIGVISASCFLLFSLNKFEQSGIYSFFNQTLKKIDYFGNIAFFDYSKKEETAVKVIWGSEEIELRKVASPNGFTGSIEVELSDFQKMIEEKIFVFEGLAQLKFDTMDMVIDISGERGNLWFPNETNGKFKLEHRRMGNMREKIRPGDKISFNGMAQEIYLAGITVKIKDPYEIYEPIVQVPSISKNPQNFGFQIINRKRKKTLLKIDTNNVTTRHILDLYRNKDRYEIIHVPKFQTQKRYITPEEDLFKDYELEEYYLSINRFDIDFLPEYHISNNQQVKLNWGNLEAGTSSNNYTIKDFNINYTKPVHLSVDTDRMDIESFRVIIIKEGEQAKAFYSEDLHAPFLMKNFRELKSQSSIYFDNIVLKQGKAFIYFPHKFVFNIGRDQDKYSLRFSTSSSGSESFRRIDRDKIEFENYPLSSLITLYTKNERIYFEDPTQEPFLNIVFHSDYLPRNKQENLILKNLKHQFNYHSYLRYETRPIWTIQQIEGSNKMDSLNVNFPLELESNSKKKKISLDELALEIEKNFGEVILNETNLEGFFEFDIDWDSLEQVRLQLKEDFGLNIIKEERVLRINKVLAKDLD